MATRIVTSTIARCPHCPWSKLVFGTTKWQVSLEAARLTVEHTNTLKIPTHDASEGQR
jgi:hypothetical protein